MIEKRMLAAPVVAAGMVLVVLTFGRGVVSRFQEEWTETRRDLAMRLSSGATPPDAGAEKPTATAASAEAVAPEGVRNGDAREGGERAALAQRERKTQREESAAPPDPGVAQDSAAAAEIAALGPLYDEWAEVLTAIQEAQTDRWEKRWAGDRVTEARIAKRHEMRELGVMLAGEWWSVGSVRRTAALRKARVEREIAAARETLARISGS